MEPKNDHLAGLLRERIGLRGRIPFAEFMEEVLYHPEHGYYTSPRERIGPRGDYITAPAVHPVFGRLLARQIEEMWEILGRPSPFTIAEMGAGRGLLCSQILSHYRDHRPDLFSSLRYWAVEKGPLDRSLLAEFAATGKVAGMTPADFFGRRFTGCLLSNELVDAFPVHLLECRGGTLAEIYVVLEKEEFREAAGLPSTPRLGAYFAEYARPLKEGQRAEANLAALDWLEQVCGQLERGFVLTIDYGFEAEDLYHPARREGTLLASFRHSLSPDPYRRVGLQDLTAHVNFSALCRKGGQVGLRTIGLTEQYKFLAAMGLLQELEELERNAHASSSLDFWRNKLAMRDLLRPVGMGRHKVLAQWKGPEEVRLRGFRDPFREGGAADPEGGKSPAE